MTAAGNILVDSLLARSLGTPVCRAYGPTTFRFSRAVRFRNRTATCANRRLFVGPHAAMTPLAEASVDDLATHTTIEEYGDIE
jgi:hypothetical protein